jgi:hypothetical protein
MVKNLAQQLVEAEHRIKDLTQVLIDLKIQPPMERPGERVDSIWTWPEDFIR